MKFVKKSKYFEANEVRKTSKYPIGVLDDKVEVHFIHYSDEKIAVEKWKRRISRINFENLFIIYSDRDNFREELLERYARLPFKRKIFFSSKPITDFPWVVFVKSYFGQPFVGDSSVNQTYAKYIDVPKWLNGEKSILNKTRKTPIKQQ